MVVIGISAAVGVVLGFLRSRVLWVTLISAFFAGVVTLYSFLLGYHSGPSVLVGFGCVAAVQLAYLALALITDLFRSDDLISQMQAAIGQKLCSELEVPGELTPEMASLVLRLEAAYVL
jgi:hypothetical protein